MARIFISYRREDTMSATGRLSERLRERFGPDEVFRDLDTIAAGTEFSQAIADAIRAAKVVLVMVGREWLDAKRPDGVRRLDDPADYVRHEIELALEVKVMLILVVTDEGKVIEVFRNAPDHRQNRGFRVLSDEDLGA
jgi:TIR domain